MAYDIADALRESGFQHIDVLPENMDLPQRLKALNIDLVITNSGGLQGFDSMCQPSLAHDQHKAHPTFPTLTVNGTSNQTFVQT